MIYQRETEREERAFSRFLSQLCAAFGIIFVDYEPFELDEHRIREGR